MHFKVLWNYVSIMYTNEIETIISGIGKLEKVAEVFKKLDSDMSRSENFQLQKLTFKTLTVFEICCIL
jgi:hypothetical protein